MTNVRAARLPLLVSSLGAPNPLPVFRWQQPTALQTAPPSPALAPDEAAGTFTWGASSILPYQVLDDYDRAQQPGELDAVILENERLRLTVYPGYGGRLASMVNKADGRELLFNNPVFQPANLASLNAWFSGGIEWNGLIPGHSPFTCSPVFVAVVRTERGPLLRLYEFDRIREAAWQVDLFLPEGQDRVWLHMSITNPNPQEVLCYWWTNIAAPLEPETRVLSPADYSIEHVLPDNHLAPFEFPHAHGFDGSYPTNYRDSASVFFRRPGQERPWIASIQGDGRGLFHTSTGRLRGRKLFAWGTGPGGRRWSDFLSLPGQGDYIELQAGIAPTQNQEFTLRAGETLQWTECISPVTIDPAAGNQTDYESACAEMEGIILERIPDRVLAEHDSWLSARAVQAVDEVLERGRAWGMLHERMTGARISTGLAFEADMSDERCWAELVDDGAFSADSLAQDPQSWVVSERWIQLLERSAAEHGTTWLHELALGVADLDADRLLQAKRRFERSLALRDNYLAHRHLALVYAQDGSLDAAWLSYQAAWERSDGSTCLAVEICQFLQRHGLAKSLAEFASSLPPETRRHERIRLALAEVALQRGDHGQVLKILDGDFATVREGETLLTDLWYAVHRREAEDRRSRPLTSEEIAEVERQNPPPSHIDFRMITESDSG